MRCSSCSGKLPEASRFCPACGAPAGPMSQLPTGLATPSAAEAALRRGESDRPVGRFASSPSLGGSGFAPGTILAERYRIIGLVGQGGMGEVYRADDLKLGQPVALKFLPAPSTVTPGLDPAVERVILRCLEKDPKERPRSIAAMAAALPGGDPLAAAIAAGETPSPEMVAAAGGDEGMNPAAAWACLISILAGIALAAYLSPRAYRHGHVSLERPPEVLAERSREIIRRFGYAEKPLDTAWGFPGTVNTGAGSKSTTNLRAVGRTWKTVVPRRSTSGIGRVAPLIAERFRGDDAGGVDVTETDPSPSVAGMVGVRLDPLGRLIRFEAVPPPATAAAAAGRPPDWDALFSRRARRFHPSHGISLCAVPASSPAISSPRRQCACSFRSRLLCSSSFCGPSFERNGWPREPSC